MLIDTNKNASEILKKLNLNNIVIDSLRIAIEIEKVKIVSENVRSRVISYYEKTGEIAETRENEKGVPVHFFGENSGAKIYFKIGKEDKFISGRERGKQKYAKFLIYSKLLGERYFEGITAENIKEIYDILTSEKYTSEKVFDFDYETFLNARATDIDFKCDSIVNTNFNEILKTFRQLKKREFKEFNKINDQAIQFSRRGAGNKARTQPHVKLYNKNLELMYESRAFYDNFLQHEFNEFLMRNTVFRLETQVKNKPHFQRIFTNEKNNTLFEILSLTDSEKDKIMHDALKTCISIDSETIEKPKRKKGNDLKINETITYLYIMKSLKLNEPLELIIRDAECLYTDRNKKKRIRDKINAVYQEFCENTKNDKRVKKLHRELDFIFRFLR